MEEQQEYVLNRIREEPRVSFRTLCRHRSKGFVIATFLAVLELARQHHLWIDLTDDRSDFTLEQRADETLQPEDPAMEGPPSGDGALPDGTAGTE